MISDIKCDKYIVCESCDFISSAAGSSEYTDLLVTHWFRPRRTCKRGVCQGVCESRNRIPCTCSRGINLTYVIEILGVTCSQTSRFSSKLTLTLLTVNSQEEFC